MGMGNDEPLAQEATAAEHDELLQFWSARANRFPDVKMGMTLLIGGTWISGNLISGEVFFEKSAAQFDGAAQAATSDIGGFLRSWGAETYSNADPTGDLVEDPNYPPPMYLHLDDVYRLSELNGPVLQMNMLLRAKISSVEAWSWGSIALPRL
jgi:hypothetical protein